MILPPLLDRAGRAACLGSPAVADEQGSWTYGDLLAAAESFRRRACAVSPELAGRRLAYLAPPGRAHVAVQLGAWTAGAAAVPLALSHPLRELEYVLDDAEPALVAADPSIEQSKALLRAAKSRGLVTLTVSEGDVAAGPGEESAGNAATSDEEPPGSAAVPVSAGGGGGSAAFIVYTSGTTGRPKGVLLTHDNLAAQARSLGRAWGWSARDRILHVLPLHHVHGLVNALFCALWSGSACEFGPPQPEAVWERWASGGITLFMAVPTTYARLVCAWEEAPAERRRRWSRGAAQLRLMVSGSAALPASTFERWREITGHELLERYGMTETGMTLSNPLSGPRRAGRVGLPLPGVELRLVRGDGAGGDGDAGEDGGDRAGGDGRNVEDRSGGPRQGDSGEIEVRGPQVSPGYWRRPEDTAAAFREGWFKTGDQARLDDGSYRILGRRGSDLFKTGGYRVSAVEVEELYRTHPGLRDVAVAGLPDPEWGHRLCAAYVPESGARLAAEELRQWGKRRLAPYKVPREFKAVESLPRTSIGKVRKTSVALMFSGADTAPAARGAPGDRPVRGLPNPTGSGR